MDAITFLKEKARMCKSIPCNICPLSAENNELEVVCYTYMKKNPERCVEVVEKWSKENPLNTNRDKFLELFPYAPTYHNYPMDILPCHLGWCTESECMRCNHCNKPDAFCWDLPYEGDN